MVSQLHLAVAKLELKQLEVIDKLSKKHNDYVIRIIASSKDDKFVALNGDWELLTGNEEDCCKEGGWSKIIPERDLSNVLKHIDLIKSGTDDFDSFESDVYRKDGKTIHVKWKGKFFPEIDGLVFIGRVKKY